LVLLSSSGPKGICYIETKNLDGETNLKHKVANKEVMNFCKNDEMATRVKATIKCDKPSDKIYQFDG
jgi:magnesium-transporting ATPase (P-type)